MSDLVARPATFSAVAPCSHSRPQRDQISGVQPTAPRGEKRGGTEDAERRPVEHRPASGRLGDDRLGAVEIGVQVAWRSQERRQVAVAVQGDLVPGGGDLGGELAETLHLLAHEEEGRGRLRTSERGQDDRRGAGVGAVVEGERDTVQVRKAAAYAQCSRQRRDVRRRPGRAPGAGGSEAGKADGAGLHGRMVTKMSSACPSRGGGHQRRDPEAALRGSYVAPWVIDSGARSNLFGTKRSTFKPSSWG